MMMPGNFNYRKEEKWREMDECTCELVL
jgi:hypothetical protein